MMDFYNAWVATPLFLFELLVLGVFFCATLKRRPYWAIRYVGLGLAAIATIAIIEICYTLISGETFGYGQQIGAVRASIEKAVFFFAIYFTFVFVLRFSYQEHFANLLSLSAGAYAIQHIVFNLSSFLDWIPIESEPWKMALLFCARAVLIAGSCAGVYFLLKKRGGSQSLYYGNNKRKIALSLVVVLTCIILSRFAKDDPNRGMVARIAETLYAIIACSLILVSQFSLTESDKMHDEVNTYKELLHQEREQYKLSKRNIELINIKCHDLKHQIAALRENASADYIAEVEKAVTFYDASVKTGSDVLDVLLREKLLQCEAEKIVLTCSIQGEHISFMDPMDIYSLFGNLLSNAIEAARKLTDPNKRLITLNARHVGEMTFIHAENYLEGELSFENGLPVTTKKDKENHGFGVRSMRRTAEKYHGEMTISAKEGKFMVDFFFPSQA